MMSDEIKAGSKVVFTPHPTLAHSREVVRVLGIQKENGGFLTVVSLVKCGRIDLAVFDFGSDFAQKFSGIKPWIPIKELTLCKDQAETYLHPDLASFKLLW